MKVAPVSEKILNDQRKVEILQRVPLLAVLKDHSLALEHFAELMTIHQFPAGSILIQEDQLGDQFFVLIEGEVSIHKKTSEGDSYKVVILKAESTPAFGEGGLIEAEPRSATVQCDQRCQCLVMTRQDFLRFCDQFPAEAIPVLKKIVMTLMGRLRQTSHDLMLLHKALMNEIRG